MLISKKNMTDLRAENQLDVSENDKVLFVHNSEIIYLKQL